MYFSVMYRLRRCRRVFLC